nr:NTF2-like domain containing protein [Ipomoea batatas]
MGVNAKGLFVILCFGSVFAQDFPSSSSESIKDQLREGYNKETSEYNASHPGRASDNILPHIFNIYASRATPQDFEIYAPDATFEDPLMCAHGVSQIKSAFYSLGKIFSESRIVEYSLTENEISPVKKEILIDNKQYYKFMGRDINMVSLIKLYTDGGKVVRHEDCWDKKPLRNQNTVTLPLVGRMFELSRRASMLATHAMMGFGRDPPNPVM